MIASISPSVGTVINAGIPPMHIVTDSLRHADWLVQKGQEILKNSPDCELIITYKETVRNHLGTAVGT